MQAFPREETETFSSPKSCRAPNIPLRQGCWLSHGMSQLSYSHTPCLVPSRKLLPKTRPINKLARSTKGRILPRRRETFLPRPLPRFRYDAQRGGGRGGVLAGGCHARLRVGPSGFGCGRARTLGFEVYLVGRGRSLLIVLFFFFLIITSTTTTTTIRCGVEIENSFRWSDLERHIPFVRFISSQSTNRFNESLLSHSQNEPNTSYRETHRSQHTLSFPQPSPPHQNRNNALPYRYHNSHHPPPPPPHHRPPPRPRLPPLLHRHRTPLVRRRIRRKSPLHLQKKKKNKKNLHPYLSKCIFLHTHPLT